MLAWSVRLSEQSAAPSECHRRMPAQSLLSVARAASDSLALAGAPKFQPLSNKLTTALEFSPSLDTVTITVNVATRRRAPSPSRFLNWSDSMITVSNFQGPRCRRESLILRHVLTQTVRPRS